MIPGVIGTCRWEYTYDGRGNLVSNDKYTRTTTGMDWQNEESYVYDETNHMVQGKNEAGEVSLYTYNGLGIRVGRELIVKDNTHGYTDFHSQTPSVETGIDKPEVVKESYVIDYTSATYNTLVMDEEGGFNYRWTYGLERLNVKITSEGTNWWGQHVTTDILKDYLHQDRMGSTVNLTDTFGRVVGRADYNEWGEMTYREALTITSSYRRIYPQSNYTGHDWDDVLGMYYAKARFYSADDKRFVAMDPIKGQITDPLSLVSYLYCVDNPLRYVDPNGKVFIELLLITGKIMLTTGVASAVVSMLLESGVELATVGEIDGGKVFIAGAQGFAVGAISASPASGVGVVVGVGIATAAGTYARDSYTNYTGETDYSTGEMAFRSTLGGATGAALAGVTSFVQARIEGSAFLLADGSTAKYWASGIAPTVRVNALGIVENSYLYGVKQAAIRGATTDFVVSSVEKVVLDFGYPVAKYYYELSCKKTKQLQDSSVMNNKKSKSISKSSLSQQESISLPNRVHTQQITEQVTSDPLQNKIGNNLNSVTKKPITNPPKQMATSDKKKRGTENVQNKNKEYIPQNEAKQRIDEMTSKIKDSRKQKETSTSAIYRTAGSGGANKFQYSMLEE